MTTNPYAPSFPILMPPDAHSVKMLQFTLPVLSGMCPVSGNPQVGSTLMVRFYTSDYPEVAALYGVANDAMLELVGGFNGDETRPAVRSMEGAIHHIAQALKAFFGVEVAYQAELNITPPHTDALIRMTVCGGTGKY